MKLPTVFLGSALFVNSFSPVFAEEVIGHAEFIYTNLYAIGLSGGPRYEQYDNNCREEFGALLNTRGSVDYTINTTTRMHTADFNYMGSRTRMSAMGYSYVYGFIGSVSGVPSLLEIDIRNVFFRMTKQFEDYNSHFTFNLTKEELEANPQFQCILSTHPY